MSCDRSRVIPGMWLGVGLYTCTKKTRVLISMDFRWRDDENDATQCAKRIDSYVHENHVTSSLAFPNLLPAANCQPGYRRGSISANEISRCFRIFYFCAFLVFLKNGARGRVTVLDLSRVCGLLQDYLHAKNVISFVLYQILMTQRRERRNAMCETHRYLRSRKSCN